VSFVLRYIGAGEVVRCRKVLPSERVTSWVKVYGRLGRRMRVAWRICCLRAHWRQMGRVLCEKSILGGLNVLR
jgi:hypothetical protein